MSDDAKSTIPIAVELSASLSALANAKGIQAFERRLAAALSSLVEQVGLSGEPSVTVRSVDSSRAVRVRVHDALQPYDPDLMTRVWVAVVPADLHGVVYNPEAVRKSGFPDGWFRAFVSNASGNKSDLGIAFEYLARLIVEIIARRTVCLVGPDQTAAYRKTAPGEMQAVAPISSEEMSSLLKSLLDLGLSVANRPLIWQAIAVGRHLNRDVADIVECIFTQLRLPRIEIHGHPQYFSKSLNVVSRDDNTSSTAFQAVRKFVTHVIGTLGQQHAVNEPLSVYAGEVDESTRGRFLQAEEQIFNELGLQLPEPMFIASSKIPEGFIAIKINDRLEPPARGLEPGEIFVNASLEQLTTLNIPGRGITNPISDDECAIVSAAHADVIKQGGFSTFDSSSFVTFLLSGEVKRHAARLLGVEDVEYQLAQLKQVFPTLIQAVTSRFSVEDLTRMMRGLLADSISIRNARAIFERILQFDTITVASADYISFDERLELRDTQKGSRWQNHCAFVRSGLKHVISHQYSQVPNHIRVYPIDAEVQKRAEAATQNDDPAGAITWLNEAEQEALRDSIWTKITDVETAQGKAPILTSSKARAAIRELICPEISNLPILARSEIAAETKIEHLDAIRLQG